ncbi:hypothetical protein, partial [Streptomyces sp. NPDC056730]|uniref:hypothetical protein n=1 Tax=Streptomyces sp. NPDC056730 TaxID=3345929 RepID=UPI0036874DE2
EYARAFQLPPFSPADCGRFRPPRKVSAAPAERGAAIRIRLRISVVDALAVVVLITSTAIVLMLINRR